MLIIYGWYIFYGCTYLVSRKGTPGCHLYVNNFTFSYVILRFEHLPSLHRLSSLRNDFNPVFIIERLKFLKTWYQICCLFSYPLKLMKDWCNLWNIGPIKYLCFISYKILVQSWTFSWTIKPKSNKEEENTEK